MRQPVKISGEFNAEDVPSLPDCPVPPLENKAMATLRSGATPASGSLGRLGRVRRLLDSLLAPQRKQPERKDQHPVVALVSDAIFPYSCGGREIRYHELTRRLAGHAELHLYTMRWWDGPRVRKDEIVTFHAISRLRPMYTKNRRSLRQAIFFALACLRLLASRFDVLEADHMPLLQILVLRFVATVKRKRFVVTWHEVWGGLSST
jgi:hypothetical protein